MTWHLEFRAGAAAEPGAPAVTQTHDGTFQLFEGSGSYRLPDVGLVPTHGQGTAVIQSVGPTEVPGLYGKLQEALRYGWGRGEAPGEVVGRHDVALGWRVPVETVRSSVDFARGEPDAGHMVVEWRLEYLEAGRQLDETQEVPLLFMPPGVGAPDGAGDEGAEEIPPIRHRSHEPPLDGWAAIDLGTSSSTVTVYGTGNQRVPEVDPAYELTLGDGLGRLLTTAPPERCRSEWEAALRELARSTGVGDRLTERLTGTEDANLVQDVSRGIEDLLRDATRELRAWLAPELQDIHQAAFAAPPLVTYNLEPHPFDPDGPGYDIDSAVRVVSLDGPRLYLGSEPPPDVEFSDAAAGEGVGEGAPVVIRDLKRRFARMSVRPDPVRELDGLPGEGPASLRRIDRVVAGAYDFLADAVEAARAGRDGEIRRLNHLVVTFPTTTTPTARRNLHRLVTSGLDVGRVTLTYDEGVAAGLYFLMRDLGQHFGVGLEAFRARARQVSAKPPTWEQTAVVVDIGGGTTDIAVLKYLLCDCTPRDSTIADDVLGRFYELRPEVAGSTGHALLGGHYLTLRVFYWLKASVIDAILSDESTPDSFRQKVPEEMRGRLAEIVRDRASGARVVPPEVEQAIRATLPTRFDKDGPQSEQSGFDAFWDAAAAAKVGLGSERHPTWTIDHAAVRGLLTAIPPAVRKADDAFGDLEKATSADWSTTLRAEDFAEIITPAVEIAADHAADLVRTVIDRGRATALDRVLLSGQSSLMPLVARVVDAKMADAVGSRAGVPAIEVERRYAKQAASLGACWAMSNQSLRANRPDDGEVFKGRTELALRDDQLHGTVPCDFVYRRFGASDRLFSLGDPFRELDDAGHRGIRTPGFAPALDTHQIRRVFGGNEQAPWSYFDPTDYAQRRYGRGLGPSWGYGGTMHVMVEFDQACTPTLYYCNHGTPHFLPPARAASEIADALAEVPGLFDEGRLCAVPEVVVRSGRGNHLDPTRETTVLEPSPDDATLEKTFDVWLRSGNPDEPPRRATVLDGLPPLSRLALEYTVDVRFEGASVATAALPAPGGTDSDHRLLLGLDGRLWVFRGELRFFPAENIDELETDEGAVLIIRPDTRTTDDDERKRQWDPFSGEH